MYIGYARVSTADQNLETQRESLKEAGCKKIFVEKITGTSTAPRKELKNAMDYARSGDTLVITKIDRLARSIIDLNNIVNELNEKGVSVKFLHDNIEFKAGANITAIQELMFNMLGSFAQFERDLIVERTAEGRKRAKEQGKHLGRPSRPQKDIERALKMYDERESNGMSVSEI